MRKVGSEEKLKVVPLHVPAVQQLHFHSMSSHQQGTDTEEIDLRGLRTCPGYSIRSALLLIGLTRAQELAPPPWTDSKYWERAGEEGVLYKEKKIRK